MMSSRHKRVLLVLSFVTFCVYLLLFFDDGGGTKKEAELFRVYLREINNTLLDNGRQISSERNENIDKRSKLQQSLVDSFCSQIDYNEVITRKDLFKHLLYDDNYKVIYCFIPKSGCTKMKTLFVLLQGIFSLEDFFNKTVTHKNHLRKVKTLADLTAEERNAKLRDYYKFMIARDPLERFISGYRDKIKRSGVPKRFEKLQGDIIKDLRSRFSFFHKKRPSFSEFVQYFLRHTELFDDHFKPMLDICHPCYVKYHLYVDFSVLNYEMDKVLRLLGIPHYYYFNGVKHVESLMPKYYPTSFYVSYHFNQLNDELRQKILRKLRFDIQLYNNVTGRYY